MQMPWCKAHVFTIQQSRMRNLNYKHNINIDKKMVTQTTHARTHQHAGWTPNMRVNIQHENLLNISTQLKHCAITICFKCQKTTLHVICYKTDNDMRIIHAERERPQSVWTCVRGTFHVAAFDATNKTQLKKQFLVMVPWTTHTPRNRSTGQQNQWNKTHQLRQLNYMNEQYHDMRAALLNTQCTQFELVFQRWRFKMMMRSNKIHGHWNDPLKAKNTRQSLEPPNTGEEGLPRFYGPRRTWGPQINFWEGGLILRCDCEKPSNYHDTVSEKCRCPKSNNLCWRANLCSWMQARDTRSLAGPQCVPVQNGVGSAKSKLNSWELPQQFNTSLSRDKGQEAISRFTPVRIREIALQLPVRFAFRKGHRWPQPNWTTFFLQRSTLYN